MPSDTLQGKDTTKRNVTAGVGRKTLAAVDTVVEALFRRTLEVEPTHRWGHNNLGLHLHYRGRNAEVCVLDVPTATVVLLAIPNVAGGSGLG